MSAIILDTETTQVDEPEVIQLAWRRHGPVGTQETFCSNYEPEGMIQWGAMGVHNIIPADLVDCQPSAEARKDLPNAAYWIGHNIDFDWGALGSPPSVKRICTLAMARHLWPELDSHKLVTLMYFTQGANEQTRQKVSRAHSALDDVLMCEELYEVICQVAKLDPRDYEKVWVFSEEARIPKVWPGGKFKGQPIAAADRGYANWCRRQPGYDPHTLEALRRAGL